MSLHLQPIPASCPSFFFIEVYAFLFQPVPISIAVVTYPQNLVTKSNHLLILGHTPWRSLAGLGWLRLLLHVVFAGSFPINWPVSELEEFKGHFTCQAGTPPGTPRELSPTGSFLSHAASGFIQHSLQHGGQISCTMTKSLKSELGSWKSSQTRDSEWA